MSPHTRTGATGLVTSEICSARRLLSADVLHEEAMREGTGTPAIYERILKGFEAKVLLSGSGENHFQSFIYFINSSSSPVEILAQQARAGRCLLESFVC